MGRRVTHTLCMPPLLLCSLLLTHSPPFIPRCISTLYKDPAWSQMALQGPIEHAQARVCSSKLGAMSTEQLQYYTQELRTRESSGHSVSLVDLWGLLIEYFLNQEVREQEVLYSFCATHTLVPALSPS